MIYRTCGKTEIIKLPHLKTLFFPLSGVLTPGTFAQFDSTMTLDATLDCLVVYLPE
jgi:hypothetical protein